MNMDCDLQAELVEDENQPEWQENLDMADEPA
jgi:hypothetical protein